MTVILYLSAGSVAGYLPDDVHCSADELTMVCSR